MRALLLAGAVLVVCSHILSGCASRPLSTQPRESLAALAVGDAAARRPASAFALLLETAGPYDPGRAAIQAFLEGVAGKIPGAIREALAREVPVRLESLGPLAPSCRAHEQSLPSGNHLVARTDGKTIVLNRELLPAILAGEAGSAQYPCGHRSLFRLAQAAVIHEVAHLYDFLNLRSADEKHELDQCDWPGDSPGKPEGTRCSELRARRGTISDREPFRSLAGWRMGLFKPRSKNSLKLRSPDPYELRDVYESFAVNLEYFLLDPEYACRRPSLHRFFARRFGHEPFPSGSCSLNTKILLSLSGLEAELDPSRIYAVHYLLAGKGSALSSRWGHSMYRLIVCAPERAEVGPECLKDIVHHVVVSYRANVHDLVLDYVGSLTGKYPLQLFFYRMSEIIDEYTRSELREISSVPLELSAEERGLFVTRALEQYWAYVGQYYFLTNNCASEARDFLKAVLAREPGVTESVSAMRAITPGGLLEELAALKLADTGALRDRKIAEQSGLHFPSQRPSLERAFAHLGGSGGARKLDDYLERTDASSRAGAYGAGARTRDLAAAFYLLEKQIQRRLERDLQEEALRLLLNPSEGGRPREGLAAEALAGLERARELQNGLLPWNRVPGGGYGVPLAPETRSREETRALQARLAEAVQAFRPYMREALGGRLDELDAVSGNLKLFLAGMKGR